MEGARKPKARKTAPEQKRVSGDELRGATFPQALRGYDRDAVHSLLDRVADWIEGRADAVSGQTPAVKEQLAKVGERTAGILTAADDAAASLRTEAAEYADRLRADAEEEARKARLEASRRMDEMIAGAEAKAEKIMDDALTRRRKLNQSIASLVERRDEIAAEAARLAEELFDAVDAIAEGDEGEPDDSTEAGPGGAKTKSGPDQEKTKEQGAKATR